MERNVEYIKYIVKQKKISINDNLVGKSIIFSVNASSNPDIPSLYNKFYYADVISYEEYKEQYPSTDAVPGECIFLKNIHRATKRIYELNHMRYTPYGFINKDRIINIKEISKKITKRKKKIVTDTLFGINIQNPYTIENTITMGELAFDIPIKYSDVRSYLSKLESNNIKYIREYTEKFKALPEKDFNKLISKFTKENNFVEVLDLKPLYKVPGLYIMVLDNYRQIYIGKAYNVRGRIQEHWSKKKEIDKYILLNHKPSIDSFGAYDTTRIYFKPMDIYKIDKEETKMLNLFYNGKQNIFGLNRDYNNSMQRLFNL